MCRQEHVYTGASVPISAGTVPRLPMYQPLSVHSAHVNLPHTCLNHGFGGGGGVGADRESHRDGKFTHGQWREAQ